MSEVSPPAPNESRRALLAGIGGLAAGAMLTGRAQAGPLDPPPGPIAPTGKPLTELEPRIAISSTNTPGDADSMFKITQPGSYYLTSNITGVIGRHGIKVAASGVTINLNGFIMRGLGNLQGAFDGIYAQSGEERITVRNGHVELMGRHGVNLEAASGCAVEHVSVSLCTLSGIRGGSTGRVSSCHTMRNSGVGSFAGIQCGNGSLVTNCIAELNIGDGISAFFGARIESCTSRSNGGRGIATNDRCTISGCVVTENSSDGIQCVSGCAITDSITVLNARFGIACTSGAITGCTARENGAGGIATNAGSTIHGCSTTQNASYGISVGFSSSVAGCASYANTGDGIVAYGRCSILDNTCGYNGNNGDGSGIHTIESSNRIEGNTCTNNDRGLLIESTGNIIIRNTCSGNTLHYVIASGNRYGPIVNITAGGTAGVLGSSAAGNLATSDPNANFSH
ncbi:MAG: right-handed parallel beta-helix repeat-containing protein [Phycisphaerales bacterium]|nr:right-handed parallel beta-helix repeat-containing protein [Phycisphaerales bacterium]